MHPTSLPRLIAAALVLVAGGLFLLARPTSAKVDLSAGRVGDAAWFFRSCSSPQGGASWQVELNEATKKQKSLSIQVDNAYPGYRLDCDLYFINSGRVPLRVKHIKILNPKPDQLTLTAREDGPAGKTVQPCGYMAKWGSNPRDVQAACRSKISFALTVGARVKENAHLPFNIHVELEEKLR